jgi:hypothetical protein
MKSLEQSTKRLFMHDKTAKLEQIKKRLDEEELQKKNSCMNTETKKKNHLIILKRFKREFK